MARNLMLGVLAVLCTWSPARAQQHSGKAIIVYDVNLREFTCWYEGELTPDVQLRPCEASAGWHPVTTDVYFVRGQAISVLLRNAVALNLFSLDVTADDLPEPGTNVSGTITELPKLVPLLTAPTVIPGIGAVLSAVPVSVDATQIYRHLTTSEEKDFAAWVRTTLVSPLGTKEVTDFLGIDVATSVKQLESTKEWITEAETLRKQVGDVPTPKSTPELVRGSRALAALLDAQVAFQSRLTAAGIPSAGKIINDAGQALLALPLRNALVLDNAKFLAVVSEFETAFPSEFRYARIGALTEINGSLAVDREYADGGTLRNAHR